MDTEYGPAVRRMMTERNKRSGMPRKGEQMEHIGGYRYGGLQRRARHVVGVAIVAIMVLAVLSGCMNPITDEQPADAAVTGSMTLSVTDRVAPRTIAPPADIKAEVTTYRVDFTGHDTAEDFTIGPYTEGNAITAIAIGDWTITVYGADSSGRDIAIATPDAGNPVTIVAGDNGTIAVTLSALTSAGVSGTLEWTVTYPPTDVDSVTVTVDPWPIGGDDEVTLSSPAHYNEDFGTTGTLTVDTSLASGNYFVTVAFSKLVDGTPQGHPPVSEIVQIRDYRTSAKTTALTSADFTQPPAAPTVVTVFFTGDNEFELNWVDNSATEQGFRIYEGAIADPPAATVGAGVTSVASSALGYGEWVVGQVTYLVVAYNAFGTSSAAQVSFTNDVRVAISNPTVPTFTMSPSEFTLETGGGRQSVTVDAQPDAGVTISSYAWLVNGTARGSVSSIVLDTATNPTWFNDGANALTLVVEIDGVPYSEEFRFDVVHFASIQMVPVPGGTFNVNGTDVTISAFRMSRHEVTQEQYQEVMGSNPSSFTSGSEAPTRPVNRVSWYDALVFCNTLSMQEGRTPVYTISGSTDPASWGTVPTSSNTAWNNATMNTAADGYRLPTEAEWEYAARGAAPVDTYTYAGSNNIEDVAWYTLNSGSTTHPVGQKQPNKLGLYDMSGNVWEWSWDWYDTSYPSGTTDPTGPSSGTYRICGGGSWGSHASHCAVSYRYGILPYYRSNTSGFRVVRS